MGMDRPKPHKQSPLEVRNQVSKAADNSRETNDTAAWIDRIVDDRRLEELQKYGRGKESALIIALTERLHDEALTDRENHDVAQIRNAFVMLVFDRLNPDEQDYYYNVMNSIQGLSDVEVTDDLRRSMATLFDRYEIELPLAQPGEGPQNMLLPPEE